MVAAEAKRAIEPENLEREKVWVARAET